MTSYEYGRALVYIAEQIIKTFGKEFGFEIQEPKQESDGPYIKDEKTRKAVRVWAEINSIKKVSYSAARLYGGSCLLTSRDDDQYSIEFVGWIPTLKDGGVYTIAELCGKEKENV